MLLLSLPNSCGADGLIDATSKAGGGCEDPAAPKATVRNIAFHIRLANMTFYQSCSLTLRYDIVMRRILSRSFLLLLPCVTLANDFDDLRFRWRQMLVGGANLDTTLPQVRSRLTSIQNTGRNN